MSTNKRDREGGGNSTEQDSLEKRLRLDEEAIRGNQNANNIGSSISTTTSCSIKDFLTVPLDIILRRNNNIPLLSHNEAHCLLKVSELASRMDHILHFTTCAHEQEYMARIRHEELTSCPAGRSLVPTLYLQGVVIPTRARTWLCQELQPVLKELKELAALLRQAAEHQFTTYHWFISTMMMSTTSPLNSKRDGGGGIQEKMSLGEIEEEVAKRIDRVVACSDGPHPYDGISNDIVYMSFFARKRLGLLLEDASSSSSLPNNNKDNMEVEEEDELEDEDEGERACDNKVESPPPADEDASTPAAASPTSPAQSPPPASPPAPSASSAPGPSPVVPSPGPSSPASPSPPAPSPLASPSPPPGPSPAVPSSVTPPKVNQEASKEGVAMPDAPVQSGTVAYSTPQQPRPTNKGGTSKMEEVIDLQDSDNEELEETQKDDDDNEELEETQMDDDVYVDHSTPLHSAATPKAGPRRPPSQQTEKENESQSTINSTSESQQLLVKNDEKRMEEDVVNLCDDGPNDDASFDFEQEESIIANTQTAVDALGCLSRDTGVA